MNKEQKISREMNIAEVVESFPQTQDVFHEVGLGCIGCVASQFETLEEGLKAHGLDVEEVITKLNEAIK